MLYTNIKNEKKSIFYPEKQIYGINYFAGEHGKGFAVVASEVRKLAERSKVAADEIDVLSKSN